MRYAPSRACGAVAVVAPAARPPAPRPTRPAHRAHIAAGASSAALVAAAVLFRAAPAVAQETPSTPLSIGLAIAEAHENAPDLASRQARIEAARARVAGAAAWMPPMVGLMADNVPANTIDPSRADMGIRVMVSQTIPWPGRLAPAAEAARYGVESELAALEAAHHAHAAAVVAAYLRVISVDREQAIVDEQRRLLQDIADLTAQRYAVGAARQADVLRAALERTRIETDAASLRAARAEAGRVLRVLLARPDAPGDSLVPATPLDEVVQWLEGVLASSGAAATAWADRPEFRIVDARRAATRARANAARLSRRPDVTVSAEYGFVRDGSGAEGMGMDMWTAGISLSIPIAPWSDRAAQAEVAAWTAEERALTEERRGLEVEYAAAAAALADQVDAARTITLVFDRDLVPQARTAYDAALRAYGVGAGDLTALLDARRALGDLVRASGMARARYAEALARAAQALGADFATPAAP